MARRVVLATLAGGAALGIVVLGWRVLATQGWTVWEGLIFLCLAANAPWLGLTAATGTIGFVLRLAAPDPSAAVLPTLRRRAAIEASPVTARTIIAVCVRLENLDTVLPPLGRLIRDLRAAPDGGDRFALAILSDTPHGAMAEREAAAVVHFAASFPPGAVRYRRRTDNAGYKAGNVMEFLDGGAAGGDFLLVLDADSAMSAAAVRRLVLLMQAEPGLAILQPTIGGSDADTPFGQLFGFGQRHGTRIWATGQAWWQGPQGPYWGHNALIRIAAFRDHARLPSLPSGVSILSHDHVEAAMLHGAGWAVRVLPEDAGSTERHPPDLPALFSRDLRWAAGNLQYRHLLRRRELGRLGRFQMLQALLHYALTPLWFALLPLAVVNAATGGGEGTPRGLLLLLLVAGFVALNLPKLAGYAEVLLRPEGRTRGELLRHIGLEIVLGIMVDTIAAFERTRLLLRLAMGAGQGWQPQTRAAHGLGWGDALRRFSPQMAVGLALGFLIITAGPFVALVALPPLAGLLLAVPVAVLTARADEPHGASSKVLQNQARRRAGMLNAWRRLGRRRLAIGIGDRTAIPPVAGVNRD